MGLSSSAHREVTMSSAMRLLLPAALSVTITAGVAAQGGHQHRGFWIGYGLGGGVLANSINKECCGGLVGGGAGYLRLGLTPSQKVLLGLEGMAWGRDVEGSLMAHGRASFVVQFYPSRHGGLFFKGGLGMGDNSIPGYNPAETGHSSPPITFATTLGVGGDVRLGSNLYLTPNVDYLIQSWYSEFDPVYDTSMHSILLFTLGLTWH